MAVDVLAGREGLDEPRVARQVRHDAQLDLRVVRGDDPRARRRDERLADPAALGRAHRDVLQVGVGGGEPPRHRHGLRVVGVHAAGSRVHHARQLVGVGALELREPAVLEERLRERMVQRQLLQHLLVRGRRARGRLLHHRELQLREEDLAELLGAREVEGLAGELVRLRLQRHHLDAQLVALRGEEGRVDQHAVALHREEHAGDGHLDAGVDVPQLPVGLDARPQRAVQLEGDVGVLGGVLASPAPRPPGRTGSTRRPCPRPPRTGWSSPRGGASRASPCRGAGGSPARRRRAACRGPRPAPRCRGWPARAGRTWRSARPCGGGASRTRARASPAPPRGPAGPARPGSGARAGCSRPRPPRRRRTGPRPARPSGRGSWSPCRSR